MYLKMGRILIKINKMYILQVNNKTNAFRVLKDYINY